MGAVKWLETDSLSNQNISSAAAIGAYTANADRLIMCQAFVDQAAGGGDYVMYVTLRIAGAGSSYVLLPKTTMTAAAGETAICGQSGWINVRSGDVVTVYVDGLAGDTTTPDTIVRWFEDAALQPATADRTLAVDASGRVTPDTVTAAAPTAASVADAVWDEASTGHTDAGKAGAQLWTDVDAILEDTGTTLPATLAAIQAKTDLLGTGEIIVTAAVASTGDVALYQGDDYNNLDSRALDWSNAAGSWPDLTSATILLAVRSPEGVLVTAAGSVVTPTGTGQKVRVELTAAQTALLDEFSNASELRIRATLASGRKVTLVDATLSAVEDLLD